jgi:hypothetical protein
MDQQQITLGVGVSGLAGVLLWPLVKKYFTKNSDTENLKSLRCIKCVLKEKGYTKETGSKLTFCEIKNILLEEEW